MRFVNSGFNMTLAVDGALHTHLLTPPIVGRILRFFIARALKGVLFSM